jgi:hypothetical protein
MKIFDSTRQKYNHLFKATTLLTNFLHRCYHNFNREVISEHQDNLVEYGWDGDY